MTNTVAAALLAAVLVASTAPPALAGEPTDAIRRHVDQALAVLRDPALAGTAHAEARRTRIRDIAREAFDFTEMSRRALGRHWQARTPAERERFVRLFTELLEKAYFSRIDSYDGGSIKYVGEDVDGDAATVRSSVLTDKGSSIRVDYLMHRNGGKWLVADVAVEGVSLIGNYRTQFNRVITTSSYADLVKRLENKAAGTPGS